MRDENKDIKALDTYYETANTEYDRILSYFDQIDNKVGFLIAVVIGIPIAAIGFASQLGSADFNWTSTVMGGLGLLAFLGAGWYMLRALSTRAVKLGVPYKELTQYCEQYGDKEVKEWVADILVKASEFNYNEALKKAKCLKNVIPFLIAETIFFLGGITAVLIAKL